MNWEEIIRQLRSNSDTQTNLTKDIDNEIFIRSAKAMEELGEVNQALLKYKNSVNVSNSLRNVEVTRLDVAEECIDLAICAIDMAMALGMEDQEMIQVFVRKMDKWRNKMCSETNETEWDKIAKKVWGDNYNKAPEIEPLERYCRWCGDDYEGDLDTFCYHVCIDEEIGEYDVYTGKRLK